MITVVARMGRIADGQTQSMQWPRCLDVHLQEAIAVCGPDHKLHSSVGFFTMYFSSVGLVQEGFPLSDQQYQDLARVQALLLTIHALLEGAAEWPCVFE
jgi:hypothetical protein